VVKGMVEVHDRRFGTAERETGSHTPVPKRALVYLHYGHTIDAADWEARHARGLVPDRLPYGLDRLACSGFDLAVRVAPSRTRALAARAARGLTGGFEMPEIVREAALRRASDLVVCWDERAGVGAAGRSRLASEPPVASGVIWLTDPEAAGGVRHRAAARQLARADCLWVNAAAQLDVLARWGVPDARRHFVPMGVDPTFWDTGDAKPEAWLAVGGGNDRHRDHPLLVRALSRLREQHTSVRLELASHHPVDVPSGLGTRHPHLDHRAMRSLYSRASVVVVAVRHNLHLSGLTTILEAMACGRPVVATATPGMDHYVRSGETGVLVRADPDAIAQAVGGLLQEPERARELGRRGREVLESNFTTGHLSAGLADLFGRSSVLRPRAR
jgi:glycosyltransferase involved in cell wall biosynthesis